MIPVEISWFLFAYLLLTLGGIFIAWWGFEVYRRRVGRRFRQAAWRCPQCGMIFMPEDTEAVCRCPRCGGGVENPARDRLTGQAGFFGLD
jgi:uncharacterized C2H2 Zn-finger protein